MSAEILAAFYERDLGKFIEELGLFPNEADLWKTNGEVKNPAGNLALHITGGLHFLVGTQLGGSGYVRDRDSEFSRKNVKRDELVAGLKAIIPLIGKTVREQEGLLETDYPLPFDGAVRPRSYVLVQLLLHLNYHLGQVNYLRRMIADQHEH